MRGHSRFQGHTFGYAGMAQESDEAGYLIATKPKVEKAKPGKSFHFRESKKIKLSPVCIRSEPIPVQSTYPRRPG